MLKSHMHRAHTIQVNFPYICLASATAQLTPLSFGARAISVLGPDLSCNLIHEFASIFASFMLHSL